MRTVALGVVVLLALAALTLLVNNERSEAQQTVPAASERTAGPEQRCGTGTTASRSNRYEIAGHECVPH